MAFTFLLLNAYYSQVIILENAKDMILMREIMEKG